jgi:hypothetical protein
MTVVLTAAIGIVPSPSCRPCPAPPQRADILDRVDDLQVRTTAGTALPVVLTLSNVHVRTVPTVVTVDR